MLEKPRVALDYTPLSTALLRLGQEFGPVNFTISRASHAKSLQLHRDNCLGAEDTVHGPAWEAFETKLLPHELWGWPRALFPTFGKLNEVMVIRTTWTLHHHKIAPGDELRASSKVTGLFFVKGLPTVRMETITTDTEGNTLLSCQDDVVLLHDCPEAFYRPTEHLNSRWGPVQYRARHRVFFRHEWDPKVWLNNIHTDEYARRFGFEQGLPEFIMYCDWALFGAVGRISTPITVSLDRIRPLYLGEEVTVEIDSDDTIRFLADAQEMVRGQFHK